MSGTYRGETRTGMAVRSFSSVSLDPPLICFCPAHTSSTRPKIRAAGVDRFAEVGWTPGAFGAPGG
ncbi:flavin reductase family protein [Streptomyces sp. NBC_00237]|uniref:flavin reductase family protein n=1 Tax=Streptomyces sp. NBC_00237 TaxID=2975687 RepID=UPI00224E5665|nr:flavin reductase [Streptomyces sp. NBC_00237]MCX5201852.1 flavin reductase family protein [Streptomyces sp. NBC_00237]